MTSTQDTVPSFDLAEVRSGRPGTADGVARGMDEALCSIGFFVIRGHGVSAAYLESVAATCRGFFDLPVTQKEIISSTVEGSSRGYMRFGRSALARTLGQQSPGDYKESFAMGPPAMPDAAKFAPSVRRFYAANVWPGKPDEFRAVLEEYYRRMEGVSSLVLTLMARALGLAPDYFLPLFEGHNSTLSVINYPEQDAPPEAGQLRAGEHTDYGGITILRGEDIPGGLQVRTRAGQWLDIHAGGDALVVNIGDLMMRWTNDRWLSNLHRVANPPLEAVNTRRQSIAFFYNPREDVSIAALPGCADGDHPAKYPATTAGEFRIQKIQAAVRATATRAAS